MKAKGGQEGGGEPEAPVVAWYPEATTCAAGNQVSFATGTSEEHESLGRTSSGGWVVRRWHDRVAGERWRSVTAAQARAWLVRCELFEVLEEQFPEAPGIAAGFGLARLYAPRSPADGHRVLVDRLWPRGVSRADPRLDSWLPEVAPSPGLRSWYGHRLAAFAEFTRRYREELRSPAWARPLAQLEELHGMGPVTLITATRDIDHSAARVLHEWLGARPR